MTEKLAELICDYVDVDPSTITADTDIRSDLNLNSLDIVNLAVAIEDTLGVHIPDNQMASFYTVGEIEKYVESLK